MRRLNRDEGGAIAVLVAMLLVVMMGISSIVIDAGGLYYERRQLQNAADAAALAIAYDCAGGDCRNPSTTASEFALANTTGSNVESITPVNPATGQVTVRVRSGEADGTPGVVRNVFHAATTTLLGPSSGNEESVVAAQATARWAGVGAGTTLPLTFSLCEWNAMTGGDVANLPTAERTVYFHSSQTAKDLNSCGGPANQDHPGGFGWLSPNGPGCSSTVTLGSISTDTGNNVPNACSEAHFAALIGGPPVLLPVFSGLSSNPNGKNATYQIFGFAALKISGYRFSGNNYNEPFGDVPCSGNDRCIRGSFVDFFPLDGLPAAGAPNLGVTVVSLTQ